jgi:hypothetical protein
MVWRIFFERNFLYIAAWVMDTTGILHSFSICGIPSGVLRIE